MWDADKKPSPLVQRFTDADRIDDVVWISATRLAFYSRDQTDGIIRICQIGRENPIMALVHGVSPFDDTLRLLSIRLDKIHFEKVSL